MRTYLASDLCSCAAGKGKDRQLCGTKAVESICLPVESAYRTRRDFENAAHPVTVFLPQMLLIICILKAKVVVFQSNFSAEAGYGSLFLLSPKWKLIHSKSTLSETFL